MKKTTLLTGLAILAASALSGCFDTDASVASRNLSKATMHGSDPPKEVTRLHRLPMEQVW